MKQGWKKLPFEEVIADVSGGNVKTPQGEFLPEGRFAIVDQGKELISGYANEEKRLCHADLPVIIFGDHTRCFKYVDFPFCMGADGVKVLRPKIDADVKYLYYYLRQLHITDGGYSRHFKYLKQCEVVLPPLEEQRKIVDILDHTEALRAKRRAALAQLDELVQSIFIEMFGYPIINPRGFSVVKLREVSEVSSGLTLNSQRSSKKENLFPYLRVANVFRNKLDLSEIKYIHISDSETDKYMLEKDDVLIVEGHGNIEEIGRAAVWKGEIANCAHQNHIIKVRLDDNYIRPYFVSYFLNLYGNKGYFYYKSRTTSGLNTISTNKVRDVEIFLPPIDMQLMFEKIVLEIEKKQQFHQQSLFELNNLFDSLANEAFIGKLFSHQFFERKMESEVKI